MTLLENLQAHVGGLIRLKTELFWYGARGWDGNPGRVCLLLDAIGVHDPAAVWTLATATATAAEAAATVATTAALLLIDGSPQWIWVAGADVEVIDDPS